MNDEFIYISPLSVFGTVFVGTGALVSNTPPQAGRVLRTTRVLYRYSAVTCGYVFIHCPGTGKTQWEKGFRDVHTCSLCATFRFDVLPLTCVSMSFIGAISG